MVNTKLQKLLALALITFLRKVGSGRKRKADQRATHDLNLKTKEEPNAPVTLSAQKPSSRLGSEPESRWLECSWWSRSFIPGTEPRQRAGFPEASFPPKE